MSLEQAAADACKHVQRELPFGARNISNPHRRAEQAIEFSRDYMAKVADLADDGGAVAQRIDVAKRFGGGNCMEMAYVAFDYLRKTRPTDGVCRVQVDVHMTVCLGLFPFEVNAPFDLRNAADGVVFCDEWLAQWAKSQQADDEEWVQASDLGGVYGRARFCELIAREGEDVRQSKVVRKVRVQ